MPAVVSRTWSSVSGLAVLPAAKPGSTAFTRMPYSASSSANPLVRRSSAVFDRQYGATERRILRAAPEEMLITEPPRPDATICRATPCVSRNGARRLMSMMRSHSAASMSSRKPLG